MAKTSRGARAASRKPIRDAEKPRAARTDVEALAPSTRRDLFKAVDALLAANGVRGSVRELHLDWNEKPAAVTGEVCVKLPNGKIVCTPR